MKGVALISFAGGGIIVPAKTPYDRELLFEHVSSLAKRYGQVHLALTGGRWEVVAVAASDPATCRRCTQPVRRLVYRSGLRTLCTWCAEREAR